MADKQRNGVEYEDGRDAEVTAVSGNVFALKVWLLSPRSER